MPANERASGPTTGKWRELLDIAKTLTSTLDYDLVLSTVPEQTARLLGAEAAVLLLYDSSNALEVAAAFNLPRERTAGLRLPPDPDPLPALRALGRDVGLPGLLSAPLVLRESALGVLAVYRRAKRKTKASDEELLSALAGQAAIAIGNARLHEAQWLSDERFRAAIQHSPINVSTQDLDLRYTWICNPEFGYSPEDVVGKDDFALLPPDTARHIVEMKRRAIATGGRVREEVPIRHKNETLYFDFTTEPLRTGQGEIVGVSNAVVNITERKKAEEALRVAERKYRELVRRAPAAIYEINFRSKRFTSVNDACSQMVGYSREELLAMNPFDIMDEESQARFQARMAKWLDGKKPDRNVEYRVKTKDGRMLDVVLDVTFTVDESEKPVGATVIAHDITKHKQAEEEGERLREVTIRLNQEFTLSHLRMRELAEEAQQRAEELDAVIETAGAGILIYNARGECVRANAAGQKMMGYSPADTPLPFAEWTTRLKLQHQDGSLIPIDDSPPCRAMRGEVVEACEMGIVSEGREFWALASAAPTRAPDGSIAGAVVSLLDMTGRRRLDKEKDDFIAMAAHELKTPLTSVKGYVQLLKRRATFLKGTREAEILETVDLQSQRLARLIDELLDASRLAGRSLELRRSRFNLTAVMIQTVANLAATTEKHDLNWTVEGQASGRSHITVEGDKDRLEQVLVNLISNGVRYSPRGGEIWVDVRRRDGQVEVAVKDQGLGIPSHRQDRVFERFYRAHAGTRHNYGGMGVGLYICREIVARHGGKMWFESEEGKGSTFYFSLPVP